MLADPLNQNVEDCAKEVAKKHGAALALDLLAAVPGGGAVAEVIKQVYALTLGAALSANDGDMTGAKIGMADASASWVKIGLDRGYIKVGGKLLISGAKAIPGISFVARISSAGYDLYKAIADFNICMKNKN